MDKLVLPTEKSTFHSSYFGQIARKAMFLAIVGFSSIAANVAFSATSSPAPVPVPSARNGKASDLGEPLRLSWPLGAPLTCQSLNASIQESTKDAAIKLQNYCNHASQEMEQKGYPRCLPNLCPVKSSTNSSGQDSGNLKARLTYYPENSSIFVSLTYNFAEAEQSGSSLIFFDPMSMALEVVQNEIDSWDYNRFVAFCVNGAST